MVTQINLFGALKRFGKGGQLLLNLPEPCSAAEVRSLLKERLKSDFPGIFVDTLIDRAALATGSRVLAEGECLGKEEELAVLPPVCGG